MIELGLPVWFLRTVAFLFGLLWGSFLNVVIYRMPRDLSVVYPASRCPSCEAPIKPYDNIPVLGYLILGGRTRCCHTKLSVRYPVVELLGGFICLAVWMHCERSMGHAEWWKFLIVALAEAFLCLGLTAAAFIDAEFMILPDEITIGGAVLGVLTSPLRGMSWVTSLVAAGGVVVTVIVFNAIYKLIRKRAGMGYGDVKLLALAGAWFGGPGVFFVLFAGSVQGTIGAVLLRLLVGKIEIPAAVKEEIAELKRLAAEGDEEAIAALEVDPLAEERDGFMQAAIPFGPFLIVACLEFLFFTPEIMRMWTAYGEMDLFEFLRNRN